MSVAEGSKNGEDGNGSPVDPGNRVKRMGGCACGEVRYGFYEPVIGEAACHCRACQYSTGGGPAYVLSVGRDVFRVTRGRPQEFTTLSEAGNHVTRAFCGTCGTPLYAFNDAQPELMAVKVGSLDDPGRFRPRVHIWTSEAQPWHRKRPFSLRFRRNPPGFGRNATKGAAAEEQQ
jgi:hypothetical protein